ncbi:MAG: nucleotidyltransferase domain-containing protein [Coriobacteriales bacterium]|nr:nucleotidyltransferase domain-containing protein [Coriobacteriales bacterium]
MNTAATIDGLTSETTEHIIKSILSAVPAKKIILFGSRARHETRKSSDIDLYVVLDDNDRKKVIERIIDVHWSLDWMDEPIDILANRERDFDERRQAVWTIESTINREGIILYG